MFDQVRQDGPHHPTEPAARVFMSRLHYRANPGSCVVTLLVGIAGALAMPACGTKVIGASATESGGTGPIGADGGIFTPPNPNAPALALGVSAADPPPAISGGSLAVLKDGVTAVAADPDRDTVSIVDVSTTFSVRATIQLQLHDEPGRLVEDGAGRVHVALRRGGALVTVDPQAGTILARRNVCAVPRGVAYDPASDQVHVACMDGQLVSLPAAGGNATRVVQLPRDLRDVVVDGDHLLVSRFRSAQVLTVDASGKVIQTETPPSYSDMSTRSGAQFTASSGWRLRAAPGGGALLLHQRGTTDPILIGKSTGGYGSPDACQALIHPALTPMGSNQSPPMTAPIPGMVLPVDFAVSPDGTEVAVIAAGNSHNEGLSSLFVTHVSSVTDGKMHQCCPDGVHGPTGQFGGGGNQCTFGMPASDCPQPNGEVESVSFDGKGRVVVQTREPATIQIPQAGMTIPLSLTTRADAGHEIFHANTGTGIACASCHTEGQEDGRTWNFDTEGKRRTMSVSGGIAARAPYHWSGDLTSFSTLISTVYNGRMSGPMLSPDQMTAMQGWMNAIPRLPGVVTDVDAVARGKALFEDTSNHGCVTCHTGEQLTNDAMVDVGTNGMFKVPSLVGLAWTSPYMHDGCAATLADRFGSCGGGDQHGVTSNLTASQKADLIAYLDSL
jgi:mono/diheme cytochrome c family protein